MQAIILAAGVGKRLGEFGNRPKSLLEFGGISLLARHLTALSASGISRATLCIGYCAEHIRTATTAAPLALEFIENPEPNPTQAGLRIEGFSPARGATQKAFPALADVPLP